jgi:hypothetical protein
MGKIVHLSAMLHCRAHQTFEMFRSNRLLASWIIMIAEVEPTVGGNMNSSGIPRGPREQQYNRL